MAFGERQCEAGASLRSSIWLDRQFAFYALGSVVNSIGSSIYFIALPLLIYHLTGSAGKMNAMVVFEGIPLVFSPVIGAVVDRISRRTALFLALSFQAGCCMLIPALRVVGFLRVDLVYWLGALLTIGSIAEANARFAIIPTMFPDRKLEASSGLTSAFTVTTMVGPMLAGALAGFMDTYGLLVLNAFTYLAPIVTSLWCKIPAESRGGASLRQILRDTQDGFVYVLRNRLLLSVVLLVGVLALVNDKAVITAVIFALKNELRVSDQLIGWIMMAQGLGLFVGALLPRFLRGRHKGKVFLTLTCLAAVGAALLLTPWWWSVPIALTALFAGRMGAAVLRSVTLQEIVPSHLLGRVHGTVRTVMSVSSALSPAALGMIMSDFGVRPAFWSLTVLSLLPVAVVLFGPIHGVETFVSQPDSTIGDAADVSR